MNWQYHPHEIIWRSSKGMSSAASRLALALQTRRPAGWVRHGAACLTALHGDIAQARSEGLHAALVANGAETLFVRQGHPDQVLQKTLLQSCALVVVEGDVNSHNPWIVELDDEGRGLESIPEEDRRQVVALVGSRPPVCPLPPGGIPRFGPDDTDDLAEHVLDIFETRGRNRPLIGILLTNPDDTNEARQTALRALTGCCERVAHVGPDDALERGGIEILPSNHPSWGDAGRILSAFEAFPESTLIVLDTAARHVARLDSLLAERDTWSEATAYRERDTHMPDPGASAWEPRAHQRLSGMLGIGIACLRRTLVQANTRLLDP